MTAAHTPGPWIVEGTYSTDRYVVLAQGAGMVARVIGRPNAHLIAAAPQLAEALRDLLFLCWEDDQPEVIRARAALTAAGVTP